LPIELTTAEIRNSKAYQEYHACAMGEAAPNQRQVPERRRVILLHDYDNEDDDEDDDDDDEEEELAKNDKEDKQTGKGG
nr:hypothetical protein [Tanacetum cinerariifolium]